MRLRAFVFVSLAVASAAGVGCGALDKAGKDIDHGLHRGQRDTQGALYGSNADDALDEVARGDAGQDASSSAPARTSTITTTPDAGRSVPFSRP